MRCDARMRHVACGLDYCFASHEGAKRRSSATSMSPRPQRLGMGGGQVLQVAQDPHLPMLVPDASRPGHADRMNMAIMYAKEQRAQRQQEKAARMPKPETKRVPVLPRAPRPVKTNKRAVVKPSPLPPPEPPPQEVEAPKPQPKHVNGLDMAENALRVHHEAERRREASIEAGRTAQRQFAQQRAPSWWPRAPTKEKPKLRAPDPRMVQAANARLDEIRAKLEAGERLTDEEEADATAILELRQMWSDYAAQAQAEAKEAQAREKTALPPIATRFRQRPDRGLECASLLTGGF